MNRQSTLPLTASRPDFSFPYHQNIKNLDGKMKLALARQDAMRFAESCLELGLTREDNPDLSLFDMGLVEMNLAREVAPRVSVSSDNPNSYDKVDKTAKRYTALLELTASYEVNPNDIFRDIDTKRRILSKAGYNGLYIGESRFISLMDASDDRIGATYKRMYASAEKWKAKQKAESSKNK
jgi:hypothetical protein